MHDRMSHEGGHQTAPRRGIISREGASEPVGQAAGGGCQSGYFWLQMPLKLALAVRGTVAGRRLGTLEGGGGSPAPPPASNAPLAAPPRVWKQAPPTEAGCWASSATGWPPSDLPAPPLIPPPPPRSPSASAGIPRPPTSTYQTCAESLFGREERALPPHTLRSLPIQPPPPAPPRMAVSHNAQPRALHQSYHLAQLLQGGGGLVAEETCLEKFSTPNSGAIFPITFNDCGGIFPILSFGHQGSKFVPCAGRGGLSVSVGTELGQFVFCELPDNDNSVSRKMLGGHSKKYPKGMAKR